MEGLTVVHPTSSVSCPPYDHWKRDLLEVLLLTGLPRPEECPDEVYTLMQRCWEESPENRHSFVDIVEFFTLHVALAEAAEETEPTQVEVNYY